MERRVRRPRPLALAPVWIGKNREEPLCDPRQRRGGIRFPSRRIEAHHPAEASGGRNREARRINEGEQLEQIEAAQLRIAQTLPYQRRVQDDVGCLRSSGDRFAAARLAHLAGCRGEPNARVGGVQRGERKRGHWII